MNRGEGKQLFGDKRLKGLPVVWLKAELSSLYPIRLNTINMELGSPGRISVAPGLYFFTLPSYFLYPPSCHGSEGTFFKSGFMHARWGLAHSHMCTHILSPKIKCSPPGTRQAAGRGTNGNSRREGTPARDTLPSALGTPCLFPETSLIAKAALGDPAAFDSKKPTDRAGSKQLSM